MSIVAAGSDTDGAGTCPQNENLTAAPARMRSGGVALIVLGAAFAGCAIFSADGRLGFIVAAIGALAFGAAGVAFAVMLARDARRERLVRTVGRPARAVVRSVASTGLRTSGAERVSIAVRVEPADGTPARDAKLYRLVPLGALPAPGTRYEAMYAAHMADAVALPLDLTPR